MDKSLELQKAHQELMTQYVDVLNKVSMLPFFIDIFSMRRIARDKSSRYSFWLMVYGIVLSVFQFPIRFFMWRPLVKLFVEAHFRSKLEEISKSYTLLLQTMDSSKKANLKKIDWIAKAGVNCNKFASTLFSWLSLKGTLLWFFNIIIGLVLAWVGFDNIFQFAVRFDWSKNIGGLFSMIATMLITSVTYGFLVFAVAIASFRAKRVLLFPNVDLRRSSRIELLPTTNIYESENRLFKIIGCKKVLEFPVDAFIMMITWSVIPVLILLINFFIIFSNTPITDLNSIELAFLFFISTPALGGYIAFLIQWKNREWC